MLLIKRRKSFTQRTRDSRQGFFSLYWKWKRGRLRDLDSLSPGFVFKISKEVVKNPVTYFNLGSVGRDRSVSRVPVKRLLRVDLNDNH